MPFEFSDLVEVVEQELLQVFRDLNMFIVIEDTKNCEGDDYIGALLTRNASKDNLLLSIDSDFLQLSWKTEIYSMYSENGVKHKRLSRPESELYLRKKIFTGDSGDGIKAVYPWQSGPKTTDKYLTNGLMIEEEIKDYLDVLVEKSVTTGKAKEIDVQRNHRLNTLLIDLDKIPPMVTDSIVNEYLVKRQKWSPDKPQFLSKIYELGLSQVLKHGSNQKRR